MKTDIEDEKRIVLIFYAATLLISLIFEMVAIISDSMIPVIFLMWTPGVVGIIFGKLFYPGEHAIWLVKKFKVRYALLAILIPLLYLVPSYVIAWAVLKDPTIGIDALALRFTNGSSDAPGMIVLLIAFFPMLLVSMLTAAGEELGWRGFVFPVMERVYGTNKAILINGTIWALWHMPLIISGQYQANVNIVYGLISFFIEVMILTFIFCWSRSVSGSVVPAILLHSAHNLIDQSYLQPLSTNARVPYLAGEQGIITIILGGVIVYILMRIAGGKAKSE